ncbi:MAG: type III pantothenate kinase [Bacteroidetes bacterium]|nr:type III pantothenate kinase [Bacteroidota bacterium]
MFLAIDTGNTHTSFGIFKEEKIYTTFRLATNYILDEKIFTELLTDSLSSLNIALREIKNVGLSSVVPRADKNLVEVTKRIFNCEPLLISPKTKLDFKLLVDNPDEVGADRICNVAAGFQKYGGPLVIIDFGTATTYDVVSEKGDYIGGVIAPGVKTSAHALFDLAAKLPEVNLSFPPHVIGTNTIHNMQSGIMYAALDSMEGMIRRISAELGLKPKIIATGGFSKTIFPYTKIIDAFEFDLVLEGIKIIFDKSSINQ